MKNILKRFSVWVTVFMILLGSVFTMPVGAWAANPDPVEVVLSPFETLEGVYLSKDLSAVSNPSITACVYDLSGFAGFDISWIVDTNIYHGGVFDCIVVGLSGDIPVLLLSSSDARGTYTLPSGYDAIQVFLQSDSPPFTLTAVNRPDGLYYDAFDLFREYLYDPDFDLTAEQNMVLTVLATVAILFVVALPFLLVWLVIRLIAGR